MRHAAVVLAAVVVLAGCGTDSADGEAASSTASSSPSASSGPQEDEGKDGAEHGSKHGAKHGGKHGPKHGGKHGDKHGAKHGAAPADAPACGAVWRDGVRLARDYEGCMAGTRFVTVDQEPCSFGQRLVRFGDHFYAVRGGPVNRTSAPLAQDRDYRGAIASCRA